MTSSDLKTNQTRVLGVICGLRCPVQHGSEVKTKKRIRMDSSSQKQILEVNLDAHLVLYHMSSHPI